MLRSGDDHFCARQRVVDVVEHVLCADLVHQAIAGHREHRLWATEVRIANGGHHGGVELIESAEVDSGQIIIQAVVGRRASSLIWDWFAKYFKLPARHRTTREFHGARLTIETRPRQRISIDGEVLAKTPVTVQVAERAIEVVVPA